MNARQTNPKGRLRGGYAPTEVQRSFVQPPRFTDRQQNGFAACDLSASLSKLIQEWQFSTAQKLQVATSSLRDKNLVGVCYAILVSCIRFRDHAGTAKKGTKKRAARAKFDTSLIKPNVF